VPCVAWGRNPRLDTYISGIFAQLYRERKKDMEKLPIDCIRTIAAKLTDCDDKYRRICDAAVDAVSLLLVGNSAFTDLSIAVQENLEPNGRTAAQYEKMRLPDDLTDASTVNKLKEACRIRGLHVSGVKAVLWERLRDAVEAVRPTRGCILSSKFRTEMTAKRRVRVSASTAKSDYLLTDGDLARLQCELVKNPVYRSAAPMRLYLLRDVIRTALAKHGGRDAEIRQARAEASMRGGEAAMERKASRQALLARKLDVPMDMELSRVFSISEAACKARDTYVGSGRGGAAGAAAEIMAAHDRIKTLEKALAARGCELRHDSRLCRAFIDDNDGNPVNIAITMAEMKFYFTHTEYEAILDDMWDEARRERDNSYWDGYDSDIDRIDPDELSHRAKTKALKRWAATNDLLAPELPKSLRAEICKLKAYAIETEWRNKWRVHQPPIPPAIRGAIEHVSVGAAGRVRTPIDLDRLDAVLKGSVEETMSKRVKAVHAALERIRGWGTGADEVYKTEAAVLGATEEGYRALIEEKRVRAEEQRVLMRQSSAFRMHNTNRLRIAVPCPQCGKLCSGEQGVKDHARDVHKV
jgi:hypothetical protein